MYEVSYSLEDGDHRHHGNHRHGSHDDSDPSDRRLIYRGVNPSQTFRLPAGLPQHDYKGRQAS